MDSRIETKFMTMYYQKWKIIRIKCWYQKVWTKIYLVNASKSKFQEELIVYHISGYIQRVSAKSLYQWYADSVKLYIVSKFPTVTVLKSLLSNL